MPKMSGLGGNFFLDGYNVSGDTNSIQNVSTSRAALPFTGLDVQAYERKGGIRDGLLEWTSYFNPDDNAAHEALSSLPGEAIASYFVRPTIGVPAASIQALQTAYDADRSDDGGLLFKASCSASEYGLEWGVALTAGARTDTAATNGSSYDYGVDIGSTSFGLQMYVHLLSFTGTSVTIKVQGSSDNGSVDSFADVTGATSGALTTPQALRVATATDASVERYLRVVTTGTFSNAVFAVNVVRNESTPVF